MKPETVGIIGGGASGMAAAIAAARCGDRVILLEKQNQLGKKVSVSGNGRCNLLNSRPPVYYGDPAFAREVLGGDPAAESIAFWQGLGLRIRFDTEGRGYPCTFLAATVLDVLKAELCRLRVDLRTGTEAADLRPEAEGARIILSDGTELHADRVILSTGGAAQPRLGGNESAKPWLERLGHPMIPVRPALVPLTAEKKAISGLSGLRVKCGVAMETEAGVLLHREQGEMLFTDTGVSGICVMQCARFLPDHERAILRVDFLRDLYDSQEELTDDLARRARLFPAENPPALLRGLCAGKLAYAVCKQAGLPLRGETSAQLTRDQLKRVAGALRDYRIPLTGTEGPERAQVTAGGADCRFFRPENMESRLYPRLHATGELLNVDGDCGGYNLMFAFLSGIRAGANGRQEGNQ
ncbi:MAG: aminoacetone oxidase family FAD-binding enzyme [Clostridia bacterium]|nr:aminoacetone oxidase family FAD-binding enzyme [Clostridia bacterium]